MKKEKKLYSIMTTKDFFKGDDYKAPKPLIVIRHNTEKWIMYPTKQVNTKKEGLAYIKKIKGEFFDLDKV